MSIKVLQAGSWPLGTTTNTPMTFSLPKDFETSVQLFETFYHNGFSGRKLNWLYYLCQSELKLGYLKKPYIITMQTYQMAILLMFETTDKRTCKEIQVDLLFSNDKKVIEKMASHSIKIILFLFIGIAWLYRRHFSKASTKFD